MASGYQARTQMVHIQTLKENTLEKHAYALLTFLFPGSEGGVGGHGNRIWCLMWESRFATLEAEEGTKPQGGGDTTLSPRQHPL